MSQKKSLWTKEQLSPSPTPRNLQTSTHKTNPDDSLSPPNQRPHRTHSIEYYERPLPLKEKIGMTSSLYPLFAYREVQQASTWFSPFELLYRRQVCGPLDILHDSWVASPKMSENIVSYVLLMQELQDLVKQNFQHDQESQKTWYNKNAHN